MKTTEEIKEYMDELFDKVWYVHSDTPEQLRFEGAPEDIIEETLKDRRGVEEKYGTKWYEELNDWEYGFLSGSLAALRWAIDKYEDDKRFLDT